MRTKVTLESEGPEKGKEAQRSPAPGKPPWRGWGEGEGS